MRADIKQHMAFGLVGEPTGDELFDHRDHHVNVLCRIGLDIRWLHAKRGHVVVIDLGIARSDRLDRLTRLLRCRDDLVVDIGDISSKRELVAAPQDARQQIEDNGWPCIADMGVVIDRGPAQVHRHLAGIQWLERDFPAP